MKSAIAYILLSIIIFAGGYYKGNLDEYKEQQVEVQRLNKQSKEAEDRLAIVATTYATTIRKADNAAKIKQDKLIATIKSGERKLFFPTQQTTSSVSTTDSTPATNGNTETRAELDGRTAEALITITSRGDKAIRDLNMCIDQYNEVKKEIEGIK
jgi:hypothetical protein